MDCKGTGTNEVGNIVRIGRGSAGVAVRNRMTCVLVSPKGTGLPSSSWGIFNVGSLLVLNHCGDCFSPSDTVIVYTQLLGFLCSHVVRATAHMSSP